MRFKGLKSSIQFHSIQVKKSTWNFSQKKVLRDNKDSRARNESLNDGAE